MKHTLKDWLYWLPACFMALVIFLFSSQPADESTRTSHLIVRLLLFLSSHLGLTRIPGDTEFLTLLIRKAAHVTEFLLLFVCILFGLYSWKKRSRRHMTQAYLFTALYAASDEFHQIFVPGRGPSPTDVLIDCLGVTLLFLFLLYRKQPFGGIKDPSLS